ncbi:DUF6035 family protein [Winogradskyella forsetii]|uniref:DUF6035 family protein n=1 Tax=Winogradskyella forsetii TaxID=2686077 RepID=UPI0015B80A26|nr:DUF6035 family protein [Winogradskyella forsetii]
MNFERQIVEAYDRVSQSILKAEDIFKNYKSSFEARIKTAKEEYDLECLECKQDITISYSSKDNVYFKHLPNANPCLLLNSKLKETDRSDLSKIYRSKESKRHKDLKNAIGEKIKNLGNTENIFIDDRFIKDSIEKRKPDVYCELDGNRIVFEIQLSVLSLKYIIYRHEFYKRNGIALIWILDNFNIHGQTQTERDIKYLTEYQNYFSLDESSTSLRLNCTYKYVFLNDQNQVLSKWITRSIALSQLKFDIDTMQPFYYNYGLKLKLMEELKLRRLKKLEVQQIKKEESRQKQASKDIVSDLESEIRDVWASKHPNIAVIQRMILNLNEYEQQLLSKSVLFNSDSKGSRIHLFFSMAKQKHFGFLDFIINSQIIDIKLNEKSYDGKTIIQTLMENENLWNKFSLIKRLVIAGYNPKPIDYSFIKTIPNEKELPSLIIACEISSSIENPALRKQIFDKPKLFCVIESIKRNRIVGFKWDESQWINFANNAINAYPEFWNHISKALHIYGMWNLILKKDKKGTFLRKVEEHKSSFSDYSGIYNYVLYALYPEVIKNPNEPIF